MLPYIAGWLGIIFFQDISHLYIGRLLTGLGSGMVTVCVPVYIAEVSTKSTRGFLGACNQLSITIGIFGAYACGMFMNWKHLAIVSCSIPGLALILMPVLPETPQWLLLRNRKADALASLSRLRGPHTDVQEECRDIEEGLNPQETVSWQDFRKPDLLRPLVLSIGLMVFQQFSGINAVIFYTVSIFEGAGFQSGQHEATVIIGAVQVVATLVACVIMDRAGRRLLLIISGIIMAMSCLTFTCYFLADTTSSSIQWLGLVSLVVYIIGFSLGWGPIPMLAMSEIFPAKARGAASAVAIFSNWTCAFIVTKYFSLMLEMLGSTGTFALFGVCCATGVIFVWKYLPETKGKSLEDIELYFLGRGMMKT